MIYLKFTEFYPYMKNGERCQDIISENRDKFQDASGSSHNHQAWNGGYFDHITETLNIAWWLYQTSPRKFPFDLGEALEVMFLHDIEKPFAQELLAAGRYSKADRRQFRAELIEKYGIQLTPEQENALRYVEGVPDSEYTPGERTMNELAGFCHVCDILSARVWHDKGHERNWNNHDLGAGGE